MLQVVLIHPGRMNVANGGIDGVDNVVCEIHRVMSLRNTQGYEFAKYTAAPANPIASSLFASIDSPNTKYPTVITEMIEMELHIRLTCPIPP